MKKKWKTKKPMAAPSPTLERDLDGYVHTPAGFLSKAQYLAIVAANPDVNFPAWEEIPLIRS